MVYRLHELLLCLGEFMSAQEAERAGLVSKIFPVDELVSLILERVLCDEGGLFLRFQKPLS